MSNELEHAFAALSTDAGRSRLAPASAIRRRADRRTAVRVVTGVTAIAVAVTGGTVAANAMIRRPDKPLPVPADSPSPTQSPPPPTTPTTPPSSPPETPRSSTAKVTSTAPVTPRSIPVRAFLQTKDLPGRRVDASTDSDLRLPHLCGADYDQSDHLAVSSARKMVYVAKDAPPDSVPDAIADEKIMVFRGDGAKDFMSGLRAAVRGCPAEPKKDEKYRIIDTPRMSDESVVIEVNGPFWKDGERLGRDESGRMSHFTAVRYRDTVAFVHHNGWENNSVGENETMQLARLSGVRLWGWRR